MNETEQGPWVRDSYTEVAFDGRDGEFLIRIPCARHVETDERLVLSELIPRLNALEREVANGKLGDDGRCENGRSQQIRQALYAAGIDWNTTTAKLAACDWVTEAYIQEHVTAADPNFLGLAIQRMLDGLPPPILARERRQQVALKRYPHIRR